MFSYCGFHNALSFKNIVDTHIDEVENFLRTNPSIPENAEDLYGTFYAKNPHNFIFFPGDRELIKQLASHVKDIVDKNGKNSGISHFHSNQFKLNNDTDVVVKRPYLLNKLITTFDQNSNHKKGGYRYDKEIQYFCSLLRMIAGPMSYNILQSNLEGALPSISTVNRYIRASNYHVTEGILRTEELCNYLSERQLPKIVSLSEDATRVTGRVQYDSRTNQIIGLTLPTHSKNGMPIPLKFPARNAAEIIDHFSKGNVSGFLNIIVAQPVVKNSYSFCLLAYGTDSKYSAMDVKNRWIYIEKELNKLDIQVLTWCSDSDSRYNAVMRNCSKLGSKSEKEWFSMPHNITGPIFIQDTIHLITKLRNLILRTRYANKKLYFGKYNIDMAHIYVLLYKYAKDKHQLTESVLNPADRQNFISAQRMCDTKVIELLNLGVEKSKATALYLKIMQNIISAFMDPNLLPLERIRCIWLPLFIIRIWRQYIVNHKQHTLKNNFLSMNCYCCIELNAHGLVQLMVKLSDRPHLFLPELFSSQPCESTFRQFRSFSSTYSTVINSTVKESISRISKIQLQNEIMNTLSKNFTFPGLKTPSVTEDSNTFDLPSISDIINEIENCQRDAISTAKECGLISRKPAKNYACNLKPHSLISNERVKSLKPDPILLLQRLKYAQFDLSNIKLKNYEYKFDINEIDESSPYVSVVDDAGKQTIVKKTSLCWLLRDDCQKLSTDRSIRVRGEKKIQSTLSLPKCKSKHKQKREKKINQDIDSVHSYK